jgi:hypothetical protein
MDWQWTVQQRTRTQREQREADQARDNWATYWELSQPATLGTMSEDQIFALTPTVGRAIVSELMRDKRQLEKQPAKVFAGTIDSDLFKEIGDQAGLKSYATPSQQTKEDKARLGRFKVAIEGAIAQEEAAKNRKLTLEEQRAVAQREADRKVFVNLPLRPDIQLPAAAVGDGSIYVPLDQIPQASREAMRNLGLRFGVTVTKDKLQRAYAAALAGNDAMVEQILREK